MNFKKLLSLFSVATLSVASFASNKDKDAPATLDVDVSATTLKWLGKKVTGEHYGKVPVKAGKLQLVGDKLVGGEFEMDISQMTCEDITDPKTNEKFLGHMKSEDFFAVEKFPSAKFVIKTVKAKKAKDGSTHVVSGDLTIRDTTKPLSFPATIESKEGVVSAVAKIQIDRTKWGLKYGSGSFFKGLGDKAINNKFEMDLALKSKN